MFDFLTDYLKYHQLHTDAPPRFATWLSIVALANSVGKKGRIMLARPAYLNFYLILVAMSRKMRKTTSITLMQEVTDQNTVIPHPNSPVKFIKQVESRDHSILIYSELMALFRKISQARSQMTELGEELCDAYDGVALSTTSLASGSAEASNYYLSIVGGTTPDKFTDNLTHDLIEGGLFSRFLIVWEKATNPHTQPDISSETLASRIRVQTNLKNVAKFNYEFKLSPAFKLALEEREEGWFLRYPESESTAECYLMYVQKVGCVLALNDFWREHDPNSLDPANIITINPTSEHFETAWALLTKCLDDSSELQRGYCEDKELNSIRRHAEKIAKGIGTIGHSAFLAKTRLKADTVRKCIATMAEGEEACISWDNSRGAWTYCFKKLYGGCDCGPQHGAGQFSHVPAGYLNGNAHDTRRSPPSRDETPFAPVDQIDD